MAVTIAKQEIRFIIIPFEPVFATLKVYLDKHRITDFEYKYYLQSLVKYIFDEKPEFVSSISQTECRTMLSRVGLDETQILYIEHVVLTSALDVMGDYIEIIQAMVEEKAIKGYYWNFDPNYKLVLELVQNDQRNYH